MKYDIPYRMKQDEMNVLRYISAHYDILFTFTDKYPFELLYKIVHKLTKVESWFKHGKQSCFESYLLSHNISVSKDYTVF